MNFNEFNELRVKGIEVIANFIAENINTPPTNPGGSVDLSGIQSQIDSLKEADTKAARVEAVQALQASLDGNATADATLKQQVDALAASLGNVNSAQLKANVDKLIADVEALQTNGATAGTLQQLQSEINSLKSLQQADASKLNALDARVTALANTRSKSKVSDISTTDTIDTFDGSNLVTVINNSGEIRVINKFTSGITGQKIDLRLYANSTIVHNNSFIRCKGNVDVVGTNANQFITFLCISGGGSNGSNGVWLEISRNF